MTTKQKETNIDQLVTQFQDNQTALDDLETQAAKLEYDKSVLMRDRETLPSKLAKSVSEIDIQIKDIQFQANAYRQRIRAIEPLLPQMVADAHTASSDAAVAEIHAQSKHSKKVVEESEAIATARQFAYALKHITPYENWESITTTVLGLFEPSVTESQEAAEALGLTDDIDVIRATIDKYHKQDQYDKIRNMATKIDDKGRNDGYNDKDYSL